MRHAYEMDVFGSLSVFVLLASGGADQYQMWTRGGWSKMNIPMILQTWIAF